jgi:integrase
MTEVNVPMCSNVEVNGSTYRITWYFDGTRQRFSDRDRDVVVAAKAYVESIGHAVSQHHAVMLTRGFLDRAVAAEAIERDRRDRVRTFRSVAHQMIEEREGNGRMCVKTALQRERLVDSDVFADWAGQDIRTFTTEDIVAKKRAMLTQPWERTDRNGRVSRRGVGYAPSTVASHIGFALGVLHYAANLGLIEDDPTDDFDHERNPATLTERFMERDVWDRVIEFASPESRLIWTLMAEAALRPNEALALPCRNVRYGANAAVHVTQAFGSVGQTLRTVKGPKKNSVGTVDIKPATAELLRPLVVGKAADDFVFTTSTGKSWHLENLRVAHWNPMIRAAQRAGVLGPHEWYTPYVLRHSAGSWLLANGIDLTAVSRRLRHRSVAVTSDIYGHVSQATKDAIRALL